MREALEILVRVLSPVTPHLCHVLWQALAMEGELLDACWPTVDYSALDTDQVRMVVQVNGRLRGEIEIATNAGEEIIRASALADPRVARHVGDAVVQKFVIVPGRLVNIVV
jgi:leucyl-tRNA synthetase